MLQNKLMTVFLSPVKLFIIQAKMILEKGQFIIRSLKMFTKLSREIKNIPLLSSFLNSSSKKIKKF